MKHRIEVTKVTWDGMADGIEKPAGKAFAGVDCISRIGQEKKFLMLGGPIINPARRYFKRLLTSFASSKCDCKARRVSRTSRVHPKESPTKPTTPSTKLIPEITWNGRL
jgi:hypothetical protein